MKQEGYVKFKTNWVKEELAATDKLQRLNHWRNKLFDLGLIGANKDGTGFGNISVRLEEKRFLITGTSTGIIRKLTARHYTRVTEFDIDNNSLTCYGPIVASSESLTHGIIYGHTSAINAVIHIHNNVLWKQLMHRVPTTSPNVKYGTPEMAFEMRRLLSSGSMRYHRIIVMAGHEDGLISIGRDLDEAGKAILELLS